MQGLEVEVKFYLPDPPALKAKLQRLGAVSRGRTFENNIRLDDRHEQLARKQSLLRLRHDRRTTLTFKSQPSRSSPEFKIHRELEVEVSDFATMLAILQDLGFRRQMIYEKWRETFHLEALLFCIDTMPYGTFLEIEGAPQTIKAYARRLQLPWHKRILADYLTIFERLRRELGLSFTNVTFENFKDAGVDFEAFLPFFEVGDDATPLP